MVVFLGLSYIMDVAVAAQSVGDIMAKKEK